MLGFGDSCGGGKRGLDFGSAIFCNSDLAQIYIHMHNK